MTDGATKNRSLDAQRAEYKKRRFLAMPLAGTIIWLLIGILSLYLKDYQKVLLVYIGAGSIFYLGAFISKLTGENFMDRNKPKNEFDGLFLSSIAMALLVFSIAIPFGLQNSQAIPMAVGILTGLMWMPFSWIIQHWIGFFHTIVRTGLIVIAWFVAPEHSYTLVPLIIVIMYVVTILVLEKRWKRENG